MPRYRSLDVSWVVRVLWIFSFVGLLLALDVWTAAAAPGVPVLHDFEDLSVGTAVFNQYDGVTFVGGDTINFDHTHPVTIIQPTTATASPSHALQSAFQFACEFCGTHLTIQFDEAQYRVSLSTGLSPSLGFGHGQTYAMLMQGYDSDPAVAGSTLIVQSVTPCLGSGPTPITTPLEINDGAARIRYVELWLVACSDATNPISGGENQVIVLDNLLYDRPLHPPARESDPPVVTITYPTNGATVLGSTPGATALTLQATITETAIYSMTAEVNGHAPVSVGYYHTSPQSYNAFIQVDDTQGLISGTNTVRVNVWDFDRPQHTGSASRTFRFQVRPFPPPNQLDVWPTAFEVSQSIDYGARLLTQNDQSFTADGYEVYVSNQPPLMQGKATVLRIYGAVTGSSSAVNNVPAMIDVSRDHCLTNCIVATEQPPLQNLTTPVLTGVTLAPLGTPASAPGSQVPTLSKSWNFLLQPDWTNQDLILSVYVNTGAYQNFSRPPSVPECSSSQALTCTHNNIIKLHLHFQPGPQITVDPVVIHVTGTYKGNTFNDVTPSDSQIDAIYQQLNELYPARVVRGPRYDRTVGPGINRDDLLDIIKNYDSNSGREMFIGIFPGDQGTFAANEGIIPGSFVAGYGTVGGRGAWANADNPIDPAHELAHNIGFDHWGCENGVTADECGVFPIAHAGIGVVGFDIANWRVIPPGDNSANSTPHAHDFMSYGQLCGLFGGGAGCDTGEWVSWYTYGILLDHPAVDSYDADDPPALLVSGRIAPNGLARLRPIYQVGVNHPISDTIVEDDPNNVYTMQGYDSHGNTLFVHNFEPQKLDVHGPDYGKALIFDEAVPVLPDLQRLAVLKGPAVIGDIRNPEPGITPTVHIIAPTAGNTWPVNTPQTIRWTQGPANMALTALVQYSPDGGATRITLGRDITVTELTVNPDELPGSTNAFVYVQVSDGLNTAVDQAGPLTVAPKPPSVHIVTPRTGASVLAHVPITLEGSGFDRQETLTDAQFKWSSNLDGVLGTGRQLSTSALSVGLHTLTLTATDSGGRTAHDSIQVRILPQQQLYLPLVLRGLN